jgi:uncharacterized protein
VNRLAGETSPYLLQHAGNPVDWYPWGEEAFARAGAEGKPILLSVGYSACHWCHVMEHESFESSTTAALMNERFVSVKVDREERPDVDALYMEATIAMSGHGGWPMTVFLTPDREPFFAGTYYPPEPRQGMPGFRQVLVAVSDAWNDRRDDVVRQARTMVEAIGQTARVAATDEPLTPELLTAAENSIARTFESTGGGFGRAPKFPQASTLEFLMRRDGETARDMVVRTLDAMAAGGMYDVIGGGFHRYSVDDRWLVPHFEKMLYDNALLVSTYLHAWVMTGAPLYRSVVEETVEYVLRDLVLADGGLASAQDADTAGVEGLTFTWTEDEAREAGLDVSLLLPFEHGRLIVRGRLDDDLRRRVLALRSHREQPLRDDKVIASWNGLALAALAEAGYRLGRPDWIAAGCRVAEFLLGQLTSVDGRLCRSWRDGRTSGPGFLDDYANVAHGLLELHVATGDVRWLHEARRLALLAVDLFGDDEHGGFFTAPRDGEQLVASTKDLQDTPTPSGNSMMAWVLLRISRLWGDDALEQRALSVLRLLGPTLGRAAGGFSWALCALDLWLAPPREIAIVGSVDSQVARSACAGFHPNVVTAVGPSDDVPLLAGRTLVGERTAVYVCERFVCQTPVTDPSLLPTWT